VCLVDTNVDLCHYEWFSKEPLQRSRYSGWLRARRPRGRSSSLHRVKSFPFSISSRPALRSIQLALGVKRLVRAANHLPPITAEVKKTWTTPPPPPCLHGAVLYQLNFIRLTHHGGWALVTRGTGRINSNFVRYGMLQQYGTHAQYCMCIMRQKAGCPELLHHCSHFHNTVLYALHQ
jgi:hypothetical protein